MGSTIVLYPSPGMGHLVSMVELGKFILNHHPNFSIIVLTIIPPFNTGTTASYIKHVSATTSAISFHQLPSSLPLSIDSYPSMEAVIFDLLEHVNPQVHHALNSICSKSTISAFIIDLFCTPAQSIAIKLNIPTYYFFTSGAYSLALFQYVPTLHQKTSKSFKDMDTDEIIDITGLPSIPASHMPTPILDRTSMEYEFMMKVAVGFTKSSGILVNTFYSLESKVVEAIKEGIYVPGSNMPPIYCIGPLIASRKGNEIYTCCFNWLDKQPIKSVVYLSFGSLGLFSGEQIKEIAIGLERSEQRFLWVVRSPPSEDKSKRFLPPIEPDLEILLPEGFLERTKEKGLVVKSWAPQIEILNHKSVGGFVTHCGWNSVLEAISAGVPMVAWPLYAEQKFNSIILVKEMGLALPVNETEEGGFVTADEIEKRVRELMESEEGKLLRERAEIKKKEAQEAVSSGGPSTRALADFLKSWNLKP